MSKLILALSLVASCLLSSGAAPAAAAFARASAQESTDATAQTEGTVADPLKENAAAQQAVAVMDATEGLLADKLGVPLWAASLIAKAVIFLLVILVFRILSGLIASLLRKALTKSNLEPTKLFLEFVCSTTRKVINIFGVLMALAVLGVPLGPLLAGVGVLGFVVGFALQETLSNFASGVMILLYRPYDVGDVITAGGVTGKVKSMNLVSTTIGTPDNQVQIVPNNSIWGGVITNVTANDTRRVDLVAGIGYGDDIEKTEATLARIVHAHELVLEDPAPVIQLSELADSSVNFIVRPWAKTSDYWTVYWDLTRSIKLEFDKEGISIPFPQSDVHLHKVE